MNFFDIHLKMRSNSPFHPITYKLNIRKFKMQEDEGEGGNKN